MCYHYAIPTPLDYCLQIMMLAVNIQLFTASLQRLQMSRNQAHEWSNSVGKKTFPKAIRGSCTPLQPLGLCCILLPLHFTIHSTFFITPNLTQNVYSSILPYILGVCCTLTTHSGCMLYTNYPYILPYIYYP